MLDYRAAISTKDSEGNTSTLPRTRNSRGISKGEPPLKMFVLLVVSIVVNSTGMTARSGNVLRAVHKNHVFSSARTEDKFTLTVHGKNFDDAVIYLKIYSARGIILYTDQFPMEIFRQYGSTERHTDDSMRVMDRLAHFFDEENFDVPAIADTSDMSNNSVPRNVWRDVWLDTTAISFHYVISTENGRSIVYSRKKNKCILFYKCC